MVLWFTMFSWLIGCSIFVFSGLRKVYPYYFTFTTFTKGRWVGEKILSVFSREFRAHPVEEYVRRYQNIKTNNTNASPLSITPGVGEGSNLAQLISQDPFDEFQTCFSVIKRATQFFEMAFFNQNPC